MSGGQATSAEQVNEVTGCTRASPQQEAGTCARIGTVMVGARHATLGARYGMMQSPPSEGQLAGTETTSLRTRLFSMACCGEQPFRAASRVWCAGAAEKPGQGLEHKTARVTVEAWAPPLEERDREGG